MKLYNPKKFKELYNFKESIKDENIKETIEEMIRNYNYMYIKLRDYIQEVKNKKNNYMQLDKLTIENKSLRGRLERRELALAMKEKIIADLKKELKEGTNE